MIMQILLQILLVLAGIFILTFVYYLSAFFSGQYGKTTIDAEEKSVYTLRKKLLIPASDQKSIRTVILCNRIPPSIPQRYRSIGYTDCRTLNAVFNGDLMCELGSLGLGSCAKLCPNNAIILKNGMICITNACDGCGKCLSVCPKKLIVPLGEKKTISCAACGKTDASAYCSTARKDYSLDFHNFPESGFKILTKWAIMKNKKG